LLGKFNQYLIIQIRLLIRKSLVFDEAIQSFLNILFSKDILEPVCWVKELYGSAVRRLLSDELMIFCLQKDVKDHRHVQ
jgi:hypothetical protein